MQPLGNVWQNSCSKPLLKKQLNHTYEKLHRGMFYNNCTAEQTFFGRAPFCKTSLSNCSCRIVTVQFLNHFLSVQYYSIRLPLNCWLNFTDISAYLKLSILLLMCINSREASEKQFLFSLYFTWLMVKLHTSDIQMAYEWHTSIYEWHTDDIQVNTSDIQVTYEYIRETYKWHTNAMKIIKLYKEFTYKWHTNDIQLYTSDIRMTYK